MRVELGPILNSAQLMLQTIEAKDVEAARYTAKSILDALPPNDFADTAPGMTICYSMEEWHFKDVLPFLRGSTTKWLEWLTNPESAGDWPDPITLRAAVAALERIAGTTEGQATEQHQSPALAREERAEAD